MVCGLLWCMKFGALAAAILIYAKEYDNLY